MINYAPLAEPKEWRRIRFPFLHFAGCYNFFDIDLKAKVTVRTSLTLPECKFPRFWHKFERFSMKRFRWKKKHLKFNSWIAFSEHFDSCSWPAAWVLFDSQLSCNSKFGKMKSYNVNIKFVPNFGKNQKISLIVVIFERKELAGKRFTVFA